MTQNAVYGLKGDSSGTVFNAVAFRSPGLSGQSQLAAALAVSRVGAVVGHGGGGFDPAVLHVIVLLAERTQSLPGGTMS